MMVSANVSENGNITRILPEGGYVISVWLSGANNTSLCSGGGRWTLLPSDPLFKEKYSLILAAASQNKKVTFLHVEGSACGPFNGNSIYYVDVNY